MPPVNPPPSPTWVLPLQRSAHGLGIHIPLPPWPSQEARLWGHGHDSRNPRRGPGQPRGMVWSPSPSTRGWRLAPPSTLGNKNNFKGCLDPVKISVLFSKFSSQALHNKMIGFFPLLEKNSYVLISCLLYWVSHNKSHIYLVLCRLWGDQAAGTKAQTCHWNTIKIRW